MYVRGGYRGRPRAELLSRTLRSGSENLSNNSPSEAFGIGLTPTTISSDLDAVDELAAFVLDCERGFVQNWYEEFHDREQD